MALKFSFQFEIEMGKKKQILFFDSKPKETTTESITQNMAGRKKSLTISKYDELSDIIIIMILVHIIIIILIIVLHVLVDH